MCRGLGSSQMNCLRELVVAGVSLTSKEVAERLSVVFNSKEYLQITRSLRALVGRGLVVQRGRAGKGGVMRWQATEMADNGSLQGVKDHSLHRLDQIAAERQREVDAKIAAARADAVASARIEWEKGIGYLVLEGMDIVKGFKVGDRAAAMVCYGEVPGRKALTVLDNNPFSAP